MYKHHHRRIRIQFSAVGLALVGVIGGGSLFLPQVPFLKPLFAVANKPTAEAIEISRLKEMVDRRREAIAAVGSASSIPPSGSSAASVPVLVYHGFSDGASDATTMVSYDDFIAQMSMLAAQGWRTISLADFRAYVREGRPLPDKSFLMTFDDGRKDSYYLADPVLAQVGFTAVMFVITAHMDDTPNPYYLRTREFHAMHASGRWELQSHGHDDHDPVQVDASGTLGNFVSDAVWLANEGRGETEEEHRARLHSDLVKSRDVLQETFGVPVYAFAYPFGDYGQPAATRDGSTQALVIEESQNVYEFGFYQVNPDGMNQNVPLTDSFLMKRITVGPAWGASGLLGILEAGRPKTVPYADALAHPAHWIAGWGSIHAATGTLTLAAKPDGTGAMTLLKGTEGFKDVGLNATVQVKKGESMTLLAAYRDEQHYTACDFTEHAITVRIRDGGVEQRRQWWTPGQFRGFIEPRGFMDVGINVSPSAVSCVIHNTIAVSLPLSASLSGSVGFKSWDRALDNSVLNIHRVDIVATQ